jgi:hypothetical protein
MQSRLAATALATIALAALAACHGNKDSAATRDAATPAATAATPVNANCPFTNKPVNARVTRTWSGKTISFCCNGCAGRWDGMSDADKSAKMATIR